MGNFKDLLVYKKAFELAMDIFNISKRFPTDEKYSLVLLIKLEEVQGLSARILLRLTNDENTRLTS